MPTVRCPVIDGVCSGPTAAACTTYTDFPVIRRNLTVLGPSTAASASSWTGCRASMTPTNNLGQMIPVAVADTTISGYEADYYEIAVIQYREKMHTDLPGEFGGKRIAAAQLRAARVETALRAGASHCSTSCWTGHGRPRATAA